MGYEYESTGGDNGKSVYGQNVRETTSITGFRGASWRIYLLQSGARVLRVGFIHIRLIATVTEVLSCLQQCFEARVFRVRNKLQ